MAFGEEALLQQKKSNAQRGPSGTAGTGTDTVPNAVPRQLHVGKRLAPYNVEDWGLEGEGPDREKRRAVFL